MTIIEQLQAAQEALAAKDKMLASANEQIAKDAEIAKAADAEAAQVKADLQAMSDAQTKLVAERNAAVRAEQDAHAATKAELDKAVKALANPAFTDAALRGSASPVADSTPPSAEDAIAEFWDRYKAEDDPAKRTAMWRAQFKDQLKK
jgi:hypothetical protein